MANQQFEGEKSEAPTPTDLARIHSFKLGKAEIEVTYAEAEEDTLASRIESVDIGCKNRTRTMFENEFVKTWDSRGSKE